MAAPETLVVMRHGEDRVALDLASVREILRMMRVRPLPGAPAGVLGVINLRGETIPVIDLEKRLPAGAIAPTVDHHLVVIEGGSPIALAVTHVEDMETVDPDAWREAAGVLPEGVPLRGVARVKTDLVAVLDPDRLLEPGEVVSLAECVRRFGEGAS